MSDFVAAFDKMAADMAVDFRGTGVATVSIWMGILLTDKLRSALQGRPGALAGFVEQAETPEFTGHLIDALYRDPELTELSGHTVIGAELAQRYGIADECGRRPPSHREMLGARSDTLGLIQAGTGADSIRIIVSGGKAIGFEGNESLATEATFALALNAAAALNAELAGIVLVESDARPVIWDVDPAPDFRNATPIAAPSVAAAIVERVRELASARSGGALIGR